MATHGIRRPEKALSPRFVATCKTAGKYFDGNGLILRVQPNGARQWVQRITVKGKRVELGLGSPSLVPLAEARALALDNRRVAVAGGDPRSDRNPLTFAEAARKVCAEHAPSWKTEARAKWFLASLAKHVFPKIGTLSVSSISSADLLACLAPIWLVTPRTAKDVFQHCGLVLRWAIAKGLRLDDPTASLAAALPKRPAGAHHASLPYQDMASCIGAVTASSAPLAVRLCLEWTVLTASRSGEARGATWGEIDGNTWAIPSGRMKAGRAHRVPLSPRCMQILKEAAGLRDASGLVFPTAKGRLIDAKTLAEALRGAGFSATVHGMRASFRVWSQEATDVPREICEQALAHSVGSAVEAAYARSDHFEKRRALMDAWAKNCACDKLPHIGGDRLIKQDNLSETSR